MSDHPGTLAEEIVEPDEAAVTAEFIEFMKAVSLARARGGAVRRFNQARDSGCAEAEFVVRDDLPDRLRVGLFARPQSYPAFIRFANAASATDREKDVRGMSVKLFDVPGENLTPGATSQDFVLNSHPVMIAPDTKEFFALLRAVEGGRLRTALYFARHPRRARIALAARGRPACHLDIDYWSTTPYLFGPGRAVKYIARPSSGRRSEMPSQPSDHYLREELVRRVAEDEARFDFMVQFQVDSRRTPIEDASVEWDTDDAPYVPVATIRIPRQRIDDAARSRQCEEVAFNPWHALADHRPLGNMNRARREIYPALAALRRQHGGV